MKRSSFDAEEIIINNDDDQGDDNDDYHNLFVAIAENDQQNASG